MRTDKYAGILSLLLARLEAGYVGESLQDAMVAEDECDGRYDCSLNALQHRALKTNVEDADEEMSAEELAETQRDHLAYGSSWGRLTTENADPAAIALVDDLNRKFNSETEGVYQRLVYGANPRPWVNHAKTISFSLMNGASWDPDREKITIFSFHGAASGFIGNTTGIESMLQCIFPCDGYSDHRNLGDIPGCGCGTKEQWSGVTCEQPGYADWCDYSGDISNFTFRAKALPCAYKPTETAKMLETYKLVKNNKAPKALQMSCDAWKQGSDGAHAWNEAVVDGNQWRAKYAENIIAVLVPSTCYHSIICKNDLNAWYGRFKYWNGRRPMVYLDLEKKKNPYQLVCDGHHCRPYTKQAWPFVPPPKLR